MVNKQRLVKTFLDLVKIDSPSGEEEKIAKEVAKRLKALGAKVEFDGYGNVIGKIPGKGEPILLNAHLDTVEPGRNIKPIIDKDRIKSDGTTVLGADPKAGVSIILETLSSLAEDKTSHIPLEIVFTRGEESGLFGALNLDYSKITAKRGVTIDGEEAVHNINISAPGYNRVDVLITGRSAHAGTEPEKGISAIHIASRIISQLKLGRIDHETTANIGIIEGGSAVNAVPERARFRGEVRSRNLKKLEKHTRHFQNVFKQVMAKFPEAKVEIDIQREFNPYLFNKDHRVIIHMSKTLSQLKITPKLVHSGGGTDVNIFHTHGIEAIVVGGCFYNAHTTREYAVIPQMVQAAQFLQKLVSAKLSS